MTVNCLPDPTGKQLGEHAQAWRTDLFQDLEVLHATYRHHRFPRHLHEEFCIGVITQGAEQVSYQGTTHLAAVGSLVVIPPEAVHSNVAADATGWSFRVCYPRATLFMQLGFGASLPCFQEPIITDPPLAQAFIYFHQLLSQANPQTALAAESVLLTALAQLVQRHSQSRLTDKQGSESRAVNQIRDYLHVYYADKIVLQDLVELTGLSPYHLSRVFQRATGLPPHAYLIQVRVAKAKMLLAQGHLPAAVACEMGFTDQSHLTKTFKAIVGVTPKQYQGNPLNH
ncbi:MAG: AraC family transcriptional regulator [Cyanobacteria bacterium J06626_4]